MTAADTTHLAEAARVAERLASYLREVAAGDNGYAAGAANALDQLHELLDQLHELKADLDKRHRSHLESTIISAAGNAATHQWRVHPDRPILECVGCGCTAMPFMLRHGQTPVCHDQCPNGDVHDLGPVYDDHTFHRLGSTHCRRCDTVYESTAPAAESERVR